MLSLAGLLSKFRIDYSDVVIISDIHKKARESTRKEFETLIHQFRVKNRDNDDNFKGMLSLTQIHWAA
jgi:solute carrier family 12 sodium/potassium/chloride transporter 2